MLTRMSSAQLSVLVQNMSQEGWHLGRCMLTMFAVACIITCVLFVLKEWENFSVFSSVFVWHDNIAVKGQ